MKIYSLRHKQTLPITLEEAWPFFSTPRNLEQITPAFLNFHITSPVPDEIYSGLIVSYRIAAVAGIPMTWVTEIKHVERLRQFVDEQRIGPFRFWHHLHRFRAVEGGDRNGRYCALCDALGLVGANCPCGFYSRPVAGYF